MKYIALITLGLTILAASAESPTSWPQFRGPTGEGHAEGAQLPLDWDEEKNIRWAAPIHGRAWSSPVIQGKQIWLTTASEDGEELFGVCVDLDSGKVVHDLKLFHEPAPQFAHKFNTYGSPTPVLEEGRAYITFGSPGTACVDTETGKVLWERRDLECNHFRGAGSSPILHGGLLIMHFDGSDYQYIIALDKNTGETVWKTDRSIDFMDITPEGKIEADGDFRKAYSTPLVTDFGEGPVLLSLASKAIYAYEPDSGKELWRVEERKCHSGTCRPVVGDGLVFTSMGFPRSQVLAIRPPSDGKEPEVVWRTTRNAPNKPSPLLIGDHLYMVDDGGIASCLEARTGKEAWRERIGGNYSASPIHAGGRIYFFSEEGKATVLAAQPKFEKLAVNELGDGFMASPAVAGNALILRSRSKLYRIEER